MHKTLFATTAALLTAGICLAQPPGITREMIERALPLEGAPKAEPGPYQVVSDPAFGAPGLHVYRPAFDAFPKKETLPVMIWGNGGCAIDSTHFSGFLTTIASHGFLVIGTVAQEGAARRQETADDMRAAIDWAAKENARVGSPLEGKIAVDKVAVMGTSCGGFLSLTLGADPRVKTIGVFNSGVQTPPAGQAQGKGGRGPSPQPTADALPRLHGPVLLLNGGEPDFLMGASATTFDLIDHVPAFYGARHNAGHSATYFHPGGGEFANVASDWLLYQFKGDKKAAKMFVGKDCTLCTNSNWDVKSKGISK